MPAPTQPSTDFPGARVPLPPARSRVADPRRFLRDWIGDIVGSPRIGWRLFQRSLIQQYRHSSLGIVLAFAPAVITALVFAFGRRSHLVSTEIGGVSSTFFSVCGMLMAQTFLEGFNATRRLFVGNQSFFRRQNIPVEGPILAILYDLGLRLCFRLGVLAILMQLFSVPPAMTLPVAVFGFVGLSLAGAGLGLLAAAPSAIQQDFNALSSALPLVVLTVTPAFLVPAPASLLGRIHAANPLAWLFEAIRAAAYGGPGSPTAAAISPFVGLALLLAGGFVCRLARPHVVERMLV